MTVPGKIIVSQITKGMFRESCYYMGCFFYYFGFQRAICGSFIIYQIDANLFIYFASERYFKIYVIDVRQLKNKNIFASTISSNESEALIF
jgi:hypothetical protein